MTLKLDEMFVEEKIQAMESHWDDLFRKADGASSPAWHEDVLAERDALYKCGGDVFEDWGVAKINIRNRISAK